jgi:ABC-type bacteriocin/lantibiotic exporter with double-glycine peptidase domain
MQTPTSPSMTPIQRLLRLLGQFRREIRYILLYAVVAGLLNLSLPLGVQAMISFIAGGSMSASWGVLVLFILLGAALVGTLRLMQLSVMEHMQRRIFTDSAIEFAVRMPRVDLEKLEHEYLPELVNRFFDTFTVQKGLPKMLIDGSTALLQITLSLILLSFYHPVFVTFSILLIGLLVVLFYWTGPKGIQTSLNESKYKYKLAHWLEEVGRVAATFKLAGDNNFPIRRADEITVSYLDARRKHWQILLTQFISSVVFRVLVLGSFLIIGSVLVMQNQLNIGQFVASEILVFFVIDSVEKLILLHETGYDVLTATEKIGQVADLPIERENGIRMEDCSDDQAISVEMRDLTYQFSDGNVPVLKNISLKVLSGERVLIAGYNGAGKSTLMQVLSVVKRNFTGSLLYNGLPKQNLNLRSLREYIGDLSSQEDIFKGAIHENITLGSSKNSLKRMLEVIEQVGLSEFIRDQPQGIDTELLPSGTNIPGSVITKLLVSRAIVGKPKLLVMEDPLGNLNLRDRLRIAKLLTDKQQPWTLIASSQDPLLASMSDRIIVLKEGEIVFEGDFETLQKSPHYERVFRFTTDQNL